MKVSYKPKPNLLIEFDAKDDIEFVEEMAKLQELNLEVCGKCGNSEVVFSCRTVDKFTYHELRCTKCNYTLSLGHGESGLFPRRYESDENDPKIPKFVDGQKVFLKNSGWGRWNRKTKKMEN